MALIYFSRDYMKPGDYKRLRTDFAGSGDFYYEFDVQFTVNSRTGHDDGVGGASIICTADEYKKYGCEYLARKLQDKFGEKVGEDFLKKELDRAYEEDFEQKRINEREREEKRIKQIAKKMRRREKMKKAERI